MARLNYIVKLNTTTQNGTDLFIEFTVTANWEAVSPALLKARIYIDGSPAPAYEQMTENLLIPGTYSLRKNLIPAGAYRIEFMDDTKELDIGLYNLYTVPDSCNRHAYFELNVGSSYVTVTPLSHLLDGVVSINGGTSYKVVTGLGGSQYGARWTYSEIGDLNITGLDINIGSGSDPNNIPCVTVSAIDAMIQDILVPLAATYTVSKVTTQGGSDGAITLNVTGGSGNRSYLWGDGPTTQNRSNLVPGTYSVVITDNVTGETVPLNNIVVEGPGLQEPTGTLLEVPFMNDIHFVSEDPGTFQTMDNTLFRNQVFPGFSWTNYFIKITKSIDRVLQFNSNYSAHSITLRDYCTHEAVKVFFAELKETNVGIAETFSMSIRAHAGNVDQSRVYFNVGALPIPLEAGESFEVLNNADGFNGLYVIVDIVYDSFLGYHYLLINKAYNAPGTTSAATGKFLTNNADFNVYEARLIFTDVPDGQYYFELRGFDNETNFKVRTSEPIEVAESHPTTNILEYRNIDNAFGVTFTTGVLFRLQVESVFFKRFPGGERTTSRRSDFSLVKTSAKKQRIFEFQTIMLPPYMHEKLSVAFDMDVTRLNGIPIQTSEGYGAPSYLDKYPLSNAAIRVEQEGWFDKYNNTDLGTVSDGGYLLSETGYIKL